MDALIRNKTFLFAMLIFIVINLYWLLGVSEHNTYEIQGVEVTSGTPNTFGYILLMLPLAVIFYWFWKKLRKE